MKPKIYEGHGITIEIQIMLSGNETVIIGTIHKPDKSRHRSKSFPIREGLELYKNVVDIESAGKLYFSLNKLNKTLMNPKTNPQWNKLKSICAPKEGADETYHFDEKSSGIYTPVLEGIAHKNPRRPTSDGYVKLAMSELRMFDDLKKQNKLEQALRAIMRAYRLYDLASHVAYFHNAKMLKGQSGSTKAVVDNLLKLQDSQITQERELTLKKLNDYISSLVNKKGGQLIIEKIEQEFSLKTKIAKEEKEKSKVIVRTLPEKLKLIKQRYETNIERLKMLELEGSENGIEQIKKSLPTLHELDKDKMQSMVDSYEKRLENLKKQIAKDEEILGSIENVKIEREKQIPLFK